MDKVSRKILPIFAIIATQCSLLGEHGFTADWFDSPLRAEAITFDELDGALISRFASEKTARPLLYPSIVPLHKWMDRTAKTFYSLQQLADNPRLARIQNDRLLVKSRPVVVEETEENLTLAQRQSKLFDPSSLLLPNNIPLPSDSELKEFLYQKASEEIAPEKQVEIIESMLREENADHPVLSLIQNVPASRKPSRANAPIPSLSSPAQNIPAPPAFTGKPKPIPLAEVAVSNRSELPSTTSLRLRAHKPTRDGKLQPAQASEIYVTTQDLRELLKDLNAGPFIAGDIKSVAELWAKAEKNIDQNPEIALGVKSILLQAKVGRARTDPFGKAALDNLPPEDKYFLIGIDKDDLTNVVTIWSKEVEVAPGENEVELTSTDIIYQE